MKTISITILISITLSILTSLTGTRNIIVSDEMKSISDERNISNKPDTFCIKCYDDSIAMIVNSVKRDVAKMDSISRRIQINTKKIVENNRAIIVILNNCNEHDSTATLDPVSVPVAVFENDTVQRDFSIESRKKSNHGKR